MRNNVRLWTWKEDAEDASGHFVSSSLQLWLKETDVGSSEARQLQAERKPGSTGSSFASDGLISSVLTK